MTTAIITPPPALRQSHPDTMNTAECDWCGSHQLVRGRKGQSRGQLQLHCRECHQRRKHRVWFTWRLLSAIDHLLSVHRALGVDVEFDHPDLIDREDVAHTLATVDIFADGRPDRRTVWVRSDATDYLQWRGLRSAWNWFAMTSADDRSSWPLDIVTAHDHPWTYQECETGSRRHAGVAWTPKSPDPSCWRRYTDQGAQETQR
jgi:hypothetical protein